MVSLKAFPGLNRGTLAALILIGLPVCGLRPMRAARLVILNVPNPIRDTGCFFVRPAVMARNTPLTARVARGFKKVGEFGHGVDEILFVHNSLPFVVVSMTKRTVAGASTARPVEAVKHIAAG